MWSFPLIGACLTLEHPTLAGPERYRTSLLVPFYETSHVRTPAMGGAVGSNFSYDTADDRHAEMVAAKTGHFFQRSYSERQAKVVAAQSGHFAP